MQFFEGTCWVFGVFFSNPKAMEVQELKWFSTNRMFCRNDFWNWGCYNQKDGTPLLRHDSKNIHPKDMKTPKPSKAPQSLWNGFSCIRSLWSWKILAGVNRILLTKLTATQVADVESNPPTGVIVLPTHANFMHYYKGNPSRWPYICRKLFDPPKKSVPLYNDPCHLKNSTSLTSVHQFIAYCQCLALEDSWAVGIW